MKKIIFTILISSFLSQAVLADEPFVGEIRNFAGLNFCPRGWTSADGQLLSVSQHDALFSLYGTIYGGDGRTTFALPDLRGRMPIGNGFGIGLTSNRPLGSKGGTETETLSVNQIPSHSHSILVKAGRGVTNNVINNTDDLYFAQSGLYRTNASTSANLHPNTLGNTGGAQAHNNMGAFTVVRYCVALTGIYPSRN